LRFKPILQLMNREEVWLEEIEWVEDDDSLNELFSVGTLITVPDDADDAVPGTP
jgi:hypothetical protein